MWFRGCPTKWVIGHRTWSIIGHSTISLPVSWPENLKSSYSYKGQAARKVVYTHPSGMTLPKLPESRNNSPWLWLPVKRLLSLSPKFPNALWCYKVVSDLFFSVIVIFFEIWCYILSCFTCQIRERCHWNRPDNAALKSLQFIKYLCFHTTRDILPLTQNFVYILYTQSTHAYKCVCSSTHVYENEYFKVI